MASKMTKRILRLPSVAAGEGAETDHPAAIHNNSHFAGARAEVGGTSMPNTSTNPNGGTMRNKTTAVAHGKEAAKPTRIRKHVTALGRNPASPARLARLNACLSNDQKRLVAEWSWGGMIEVKETPMPGDRSMWLLACFDPIRSELVIPGRGTIPVDAESFHRDFGVPNEGSCVSHELDPEAISFMNEQYGIENGIAPTFQEWCTVIKNMNGVADIKFLRAYFAGVMSCFISPTTKCRISPGCYGAIMNLEKFRASNICQFVVDQIISEVKKMGCRKNSVCCCLYHLVVDEPIPPADECPIRAAAWTNQLIQAVIQKDRKPRGSLAS